MISFMFGIAVVQNPNNLVQGQITIIPTETSRLVIVNLLIDHRQYKKISIWNYYSNFHSKKI